MAVIKNEICDNCGTPFTGLGCQSICPKCSKEKSVQSKVDWLTQRRFNEKENRERTFEERVAWIEEWIYNHKDLAAKQILEDNIPF